MGTLELVIAIVVALVVVAVLVAAAWAFFRRQRTNRLHRRFGPEYEHTVTTIGDRRQAEAELADREKQAKSLQTRPRVERKWSTFLRHGKECKPALLISPLRLLPMLRIW